LKNKIIIGVCAAMTLALLSTAYVCNMNSESGANLGSAVNNVSKQKLKKTGDGVKADFSEIRLNQDQLIKASDLVVRCIFSGEKAKEDRTSITKDGNGKEFSVTLPVTTYKMKLIENLKGKADVEFEVGTLGSGYEYLETGDEYVLFLVKNKNDTYTPLSYSQGLNILRQKNSDSKNIAVDSAVSDVSVFPDDALEIKSAETNEVINYKQLKEKIKELEK
jgi:hypothetical protein